MEDFNRALMAKLAWKAVDKEDRPWVKILLAKYCKGGDLWSCELKQADSLVWRYIMEVRDMVLKEKCFLMGNGKSIDIRKQSWIPWIDPLHLRAAINPGSRCLPEVWK